MGVETKEDAFVATKQAIYSILADRDVRGFYRGGDERGNKIVDAIERMVNEGRYGSRTPQNAIVTANKVGGFVQEGEFYSQTYSVSANVNVGAYEITQVINMPAGGYIADTNNNPKTIFNGNENFKVVIPKSELVTDINPTVLLQAKCETYPIFYGITPNPAWQNYAITFDPYGDYGGAVNMNIPTNTAKIVINKTDNETNNPIANTTFRLAKLDGTIIANGTTNDNGVVEFSNLYAGQYQLQEISANDNYILNSQVIDVTLEYNEIETVNVSNEHKKGDLKVIKVDKDNNNIALGGVIFDLYSKEFDSVIGTYTTNQDGEILVQDLRIGEYVLIEKETNKWYDLAENTDVVVEWNVTSDNIVENELKKGQVRIIKIDKDNNEVLLEGVKFNILDNTGKVLETIMTDSNGQALTSRYAIRDFSELTIQEVETLENYVLNEEIKTIVLEENQIKDIEFENELKKGQVRIIKVDKDNNEVLLEGVKFNVLDEDGEIVDTMITDKNGEATSKRLRIDKEYTVQEVETLENYVLNEETKTIVLEENQIKDIEFENELKKGQVRIIKVDKDNNEVLLEGVKFNVLDEDGEIVDTLITDKNGEATSKRLRIDKEYTVQEVETLENYVLNEETKTIVLEENQIKDIQFENELIKGYINIIKKSAEDNIYNGVEKDTNLQGAEFEIYNSDMELVDTVVTDENGTALTKELLKDTYIIKEISAPDYYILNTKEFEAEIIEHQKVVDVEIKDENVDIKVEIEKYGYIETQSNDNVKYEFKNIKNSSNISLDNFIWNDTLPTDAVRIDKLYTGTWNEKLEYDVYYKTNNSEEFILFKEDLNTSVVYELDFKEIKLQENEYITEYEFRFGTVKSGFKEDIAPILYCDVIDGLGNGYIFTNNTKVSGNYLDEYVEDKSEWTTITYLKEIEKLEKLPKTGV